MSTKDRRQREMAHREHLFLKAAREVIQQQGLLNLQMSKVAERCDYAVGTLYQHFQSKEDLLVALAGDEIQERVQAFQRVRAWKAPTRDRMLGFAVADMVLAQRFPELFRLQQFAFTEVIWDAAPLSRRQASMAAYAPLRESCEAVVDEAEACGDLDLRGLNKSQVCLAPWSLVVGMHAIVHNEGVADRSTSQEPYRLLLRHCSALLNGLGWRPLCDETDHAALDRLALTVCEEVLHEKWLPCLACRC
ncbi:transcriptional regulator, TetR family [Solimonas aquatica]|uniref:Transcriptional regulator, TetR family n=1 Tax=Solimonas aquatica TaxID=489703 RepID=A0A1H9GV66_9GAMM|nr:TetR/AcrR family transcriptional regulator [Solimonas aquatica]SEQ53981.1 transcriptional regulator, TetR family [Solimonas aquatica]